MRHQSASARGGSPAAREKRSVFPERVKALTIISSYVALYIYSLKNNKQYENSLK
ncbi:hypothetical protein ACFQ3N_20125 [Virgibacillus byunsanensis]|uniref:Uncharacterized protein n=1 Tax=Virgibacillus byunsanensis TaxID=570945 RepID=A0ABW3LQH9_9BACI